MEKEETNELGKLDIGENFLSNSAQKICLKILATSLISSLFNIYQILHSLAKLKNKKVSKI